MYHEKQIYNEDAEKGDFLVLLLAPVLQSNFYQQTVHKNVEVFLKFDEA